MRCPACRTELREAVKHCNQCGYHFSEADVERQSIYFEMEAQMMRLNGMEAEFHRGLTTGLAGLQQRMARFHRLLEEDIHRGIAATAQVAAAPPADISAAAPSVSPESSVAAAPATPVAPPERTSPGPLTAPPAPPPAPPPGPKPGGPGMEIRVGQKLVLIIGIVIMVFAIGYFLKYSFDQGWVGPAGRVAMAYIWGIGLLLAGNRFRAKGYPVFGLCLIGGGIAVLYFATFAAFQVYHLTGQVLSFGVMVLITALTCFLAVVYDTRWLAVLGLIGGFLTPLFLSTGVDNQLGLMSYLTILNLGLLGIALYKRWGLLNALGFCLTYILYAGWYFSYYENAKFWPAIIFLNIFYLIYAIVPFAYQFFRGKSGNISGFLIIIPNSFLAFAFSYVMIERMFSLPYVSVISIFYALVFLGMATYLVQRGRQSLDAFVILLANATLFLIITVPIIFSEHWITIFWTAQAFALLWMGVRLARKSLVFGALFLLGATTLKFIFYDYPDVFQLGGDMAFFPSYTHALTARLLTSALLIAALYGFTRLCRPENAPPDMANTLPVIRVLAAIGFGLTLFIVLNIEVAAWFYDYLPGARFAATSILWTLFSVCLMLLGFRNRQAWLRHLSLALFTVTILKVFFVDMAEVSTPYRIVSFFILGLVLVGVSYLYYRYKDQLLESVKTLPEEEDQP